MKYEYKTLFEMDPEVKINELAADGWDVIHSAPCPPYQDSFQIYVLLAREVVEKPLAPQPDRG